MALDRLESFAVYGTDCLGPDGTCVRDYVPVEDLAEAHLSVPAAATAGEHLIVGVGDGSGCSVREVIEAARRVTGYPIRHVAADRGPGDPAVLVASADRARARLGWRPAHPDLGKIFADARELAGKHRTENRP